MCKSWLKESLADATLDAHHARRSLSVNPIYYVFFTTSTIIASAILFQGFNTTDAGKTVSLICGFLIIFMGVYLLNLSREPEQPKGHSALETGMMSESLSRRGVDVLADFDA